MGGSSTLFPKVPRMMARKKVINEGKMLAASIPIMKMPMPINIPVFLPRRSAMGAKKGPIALVVMETASASEITPTGTFNPPAKIARKG